MNELQLVAIIVYGWVMFGIGHYLRPPKGKSQVSETPEVDPREI